MCKDCVRQELETRFNELLKLFDMFNRGEYPCKKVVQPFIIRTMETIEEEDSSDEDEELTD